MGCGMSMVKYILFLFNLLCAISGILIITFGAILLSSTVQNFADLKDAFSHNSLPIGLIVLGSIIFLISFYGCCGAIRESYCMSMTYSVLLFVLLIIQLALVVYAFTSKDEYIKQMGKVVDEMWSKTNQNRQSDYMDALQIAFKCCGLNGATDYSLFGTLPKSCCDIGVQNCIIINANYRGCKSAFTDWWRQNWNVITYAGLGIALIELVGVVFACCLANHVRNQRRRSAY